jgi:hypothetical protein
MDGSREFNDARNRDASFAVNDLTNTSFVGSVVVKAWHFIAGYRGGYDTATNKMTNNDFGIICDFANFDFHFRCTDIPYEYGMSLTYKGKPEHHLCAGDPAQSNRYN